MPGLPVLPKSWFGGVSHCSSLAHSFYIQSFCPGSVILRNSPVGRQVFKEGLKIKGIGCGCSYSIAGGRTARIIFTSRC